MTHRQPTLAFPPLYLALNTIAGSRVTNLTEAGRQAASAKDESKITCVQRETVIEEELFHHSMEDKNYAPPKFYLGNYVQNYGSKSQPWFCHVSLNELVTVVNECEWRVLLSTQCMLGKAADACDVN